MSADSSLDPSAAFASRFEGMALNPEPVVS